jgi:drug/metabolite transporter (DMT)-like permease
MSEAADSSTIKYSHNVGTILAILSGILYGSLAYLGVTQLSSIFSIYDVLFWRFLLASAFLLPLTLNTTSTEDDTLKNLFLAFFIGGGFYGLSTIFYFWSAEEVGTGVSMVIFFTFPLFVALLSWLLDQQRFNYLTYASVILIFIGLALLMGKVDSNFCWKSSLLGLGSGLSFAFFVYMSKKLKISPMKFTVLVCLGSAVTVWVTGNFVSDNLYLPSLDAPWFKVIMMSFIATALPILLFQEAVKRICATKASLLTIFEPTTTVFIGILFLGEYLGITQILGMLILLIGATLAHYDK